MRILKFAFTVLIFFAALQAGAQIRGVNNNAPRFQSQDTVKSLSLDSLRKREESRRDSIVPTAKFIRYTNSAALKDSTQTFALDTMLHRFQNYNVLHHPENPSINLGQNGLAYRDLLFQPTKSIGFQSGFHALDRYLMRSDSVRYYIARSPYTELYYVSGKAFEQVFKVTHTQNIKPNWNVGVNYNRIGGDGLYKNQQPDHLNAAVFTWYRSPKQRYQLLAHALFNYLKAGENGSTVRQDVFEGDQLFSKDAEPVRLSAVAADRPRQTWRENTLFLKQTYDFGRRDSVGPAALIPTQRIAYTISYTKNLFRFFRNEPDTYLVFPHAQPETITQTNDTTEIRHLRNVFVYSFYLRGRSVSFLRNELKLDLGARSDLYNYLQMGAGRKQQNSTLTAGLGYRFNERVKLNVNLEQIAQGSQSGDYLYEAQTQILLSNAIGKITIGAYLQRKSPEELFNRVNYQFHQWNKDFSSTTIQQLAFRYAIPNKRFFVQAEYYRMKDYLYFQETALDKQIEPAQYGAQIDLLKFSLSNHSRLGKFHLENYVVFQKSTDLEVLRTPEWYTWNSLYYDFKLFKVLHTNFGVDVRYNTTFFNPAYAINVGQFYNQQNPLKLKSEPVFDLFVRATLKRANLFLKYEYLNQGWTSKGFYTVDRYPMPDRVLKFGVSWKFFN